MRGMRLWIFSVAVCLVQLQAVRAEEAAVPTEGAKAAKIRQLLVLSGSGDMGVQVVNQMTAMLRESLPDAPEGFWEEFLAGVNADEMIEMVVPIYDKYLDEADIDALTAFYSSPAGRKLLEVLPQIMMESMQAGQKWGEELARRAVERAKREGIQVGT